MTLLSIVHAFTLAEPQAPTGSKEGNAAVTDFVDNLHKCSQCEEAEAELLCIDCTKEFCSGCFKVLHKSSKKKGHKTQAIEGAAGAAESSGAEMCFQVNTRYFASYLGRFCSFPRQRVCPVGVFGLFTTSFRFVVVSLRAVRRAASRSHVQGLQQKALRWVQQPLTQEFKEKSPRKNKYW
jgi:hypothetical protein